MLASNAAMFDILMIVSRVMDMVQKTFQNSMERDKDDWVELFGRASSRFHLVSIQQPKGAQLSVVEFQWR
jgi:hypothetical protein